MSNRTRIERLEQRADDTSPLFLLCTYVAPEGNEVEPNGYSCDGHSVERQPDETGDEMLVRLIELVGGGHTGCRAIEPQVIALPENGRD